MFNGTLCNKMKCYELQGNYVGMTEDEMNEMNPVELRAKVENATRILYQVQIIFKSSS